jgi:hypothetical protein
MFNTMDWNGAAYWIAAHVRGVAGTIGVTGFGVGFVKFLRHAPAPKKSSVWAGCLFDTFQDLVSNDSRIGERRDDAAGAVASAAPGLEPPG